MNRTELLNKLHEGTVVVDFTKANGEFRSMTCTLKQDEMGTYQRKTNRPAREKPDNMLAVWDVNADGEGAFRTLTMERISAVDGVAVDGVVDDR